MTRRKLLPVLLLVLFVAVVISSMTFQALETHHDCPGHDCPICYTIHVCNDVLSDLYFAASLAAAYALSLAAAVQCLCFREAGTFRSDLVALSVKLSR